MWSDRHPRSTGTRSTTLSNPHGIAPTSSENGIGWGESYEIRSFISMYRAAKARGEAPAEQQKFLSWIVEHCDNLVNNHMRARYSDGTIYLVLEGNGFAPVAMFVRMVFEDRDCMQPIIPKPTAT